MVKETPCQGREIPNISEDTIGDPLRPVPLDSLLEVVKSKFPLPVLIEITLTWPYFYYGSGTTALKCDGLDYMQIKASMGKEDNKHIKGLLGMVKGEGLKLAKS
ncbi:unnamed protein product [Prunus armeniaca]|uniref:Uncharacterized protein n=1 Tax=Prunus armeniaca TaxID=36596 RepID=A0A6J5VAM6_PRUAR|nr:unnamed protein product [Prunus armeniaca]CAB4316486.1 unnamed protein product [Prunus armeniaca]